MKKFFFLFAVSLLAKMSWAQPATFVDDILTIPQAALIDAVEPVYYADVQLADNGDGTLSVVAGEAQNLVNVDSIEVLIMESFPVQVSVAVSGNLSVPCVELLPAAVARKDSVFTVILAETVLGPAETCIAIIEPFETNVSLDVLGLAAGDYTVVVNGVEAEFTLDSDNVLSN
ncbi:MAG: hypothetical protein MI746_17580 [Pseudomonadales bacterium]|nr:hypothetical protein [Pseudomonadales bacterium]